MILTIKDLNTALFKLNQFTDARTLRVVIGANVRNAIIVDKVNLITLRRHRKFTLRTM
jgi:hypothetical protein